LNIEDNSVEFYGIEFKTIIEAVKFLKNVEPGIKYGLWFFRRHKGLMNTNDGWIYVDLRWFPDSDMAEDHIKNKSRYNR
jgi:hypothetical protein